MSDRLGGSESVKENEPERCVKAALVLTNHQRRKENLKETNMLEVLDGKKKV